ncbi:MAG: hypothetical protein O7C65_10165 [Planctomycetota bacterium]|nr:hypothetical protein [Planctomycetota bacterium]
MPRRKRRRRKTKPAPKQPLVRIDAVTRKRIAAGVSWALAVGGVITASVLGVPRLQAYASDRQQMGEIEVRFVNSPAWVTGDLQEMLVLTAAVHISADPLRRDGLVTARRALLATGWFQEVRQVRRVGAGLVEIDARFAQPFAVIRDADGDHLVDPRGRLMPKTFPVGGAEKFTAILGARSGRPAGVGQQWEGSDVTAALGVLRLIHAQPWRQQVAEVDLTHDLPELSIRLITDRGCTIVWGRPPGEERGGEVPATRKLSYLDYHYQHYGHIDRGFARELDITGDVVIGR